MKPSRRSFLVGCLFASGGLLLAACGAPAPPTATSAPVKPAEKPTAPPKPAAEPTKPAAAPANTPAAALAATKPAPAAAAPAAAGGAADVKIWFHWGGATGEAAQKLIDQYNTTRGAQDRVKVTVETVSSNPNEYRAKMTAARMAGTSPDVYHAGLAVSELVKAEVPADLPPEESAYVRQSYAKSAVDRMTYAGKVWAYPTEHSAGAFMYRKSVLKEVGAEPPKTTDDVREVAKRTTKLENGKPTRIGFTFNPDNPVPFYFAEAIARFGGRMITFDGDKPIKVDVTSPEAVEAMTWYRSMVEDGSTQVGQMSWGDAWKNGLGVTTDAEPWFPLINLRDGGKREIYDDLGFAQLPAKKGVKPVAYVNGWELFGGRDSKQSDARWKFVGWMMHKPEMPFSRFIVEKIGAIPAPLDYPAEIPGWSKDQIDGYLKETLPITEPHILLRVLGKGEMDKLCADAVQSIVLKKQTPADALKQIQPQLEEILKRNNP